MDLFLQVLATMQNFTAIVRTAQEEKQFLGMKKFVSINKNHHHLEFVKQNKKK